MSNDTINVQRGIVGAGSDDDTYVLSANLIDANAEITITDVEGANKIQLIGGLTITSSIVAGDTAQLTLSNGAVVTVLGASTMSYEVGGNPLTGTAGVTKDYSTFVADVLGTTVPTTGTSTGGESTVNEDGTATGGTTDPTDPTDPSTDPTYTLTAGAASVDEGSTATFNLATTNVDDGTTVSYTISGVAAEDVTGGSLTGTATITSGVATISVELAADSATEGTETLTVSIDGQSATASTSVNDTSVADAGVSYTLTTAADALTTGSGDDTITAPVDTLGSSDTIFDESTSDSDVLTATLTASSAPTIKNIETVNINWDSNSNIAFDATSIVNSTINFDAVSLAFSGAATITAAGSNALNFNSDVTGLLTVNGVVDSAIDTGNATSLTLGAGTAPTAGGKTKATLTVNKSMSAANAVTNAVDELTVTSTLEGAKLDITSADILDSLTVTGDKSVVIQTDLNQAKETITSELTGGATLNVISDTAGAIDLSGITADKITIATATGAATTTVKDGQTIVAGLANALEDIDAATGVSNASVNLSTGFDIATLNITGIKTLNLEATADIAIGGTAFTTDDANIVNITGSKKVTLTQAGASTSASIDANAATGKFTYVGADVATGVVGSSTAVNTITLNNTTSNAGFVGGTAADTVTLGAALTSGTVNATMGSGDDTFDFSTLAVATGSITIAGGSGNDVIKLGKVDNVIGATLNISDVEEIIALDNIQFNETHLGGKTYKMTATSADDTFLVTVANSSSASAVTTDLSGLTFNNLVNSNFSATTITGADNTADTIIATSLNDTINGGTGADVITLGTGVDIVQTGLLGSTETAMDTITGFTAAANTAVAGGDKLTFAVAGVVAADAVATDVSAAISGELSSDVATATISNGIVALAGVNADKIDTLAEWIDVAQLMLDVAVVAQNTVAFEFSGNTYVVQDGLTTGTADDIIVELTGLTGVTAVSAAAAAANTLFIG